MSEKTPEDRPFLQRFDELHERFRPLLRWMTLMALVSLLSMDVYLYSVNQAMSSRLAGISHRMDRQEKLISDAFQAMENSDKIKDMETHISDMESDLTDVADLLKVEESKSKSKKRRR